MKFLRLFEREQDLKAIQRVDKELEEINTGIESFFNRVLSVFQIENSNSQELLDVLNSFYNTIHIGGYGGEDQDLGGWNIKFGYGFGRKRLSGTVMASVITGERLITLFCLDVKPLSHLLSVYRQNIPSGQSAHTQERVSEIRRKASVMVKGLLKKLKGAQLQFILRHEIHHEDDGRTGDWYIKSKMDLWKNQAKAHELAKKEFGVVDHSTYQRRSEDIARKFYDASSHEYNANTRAAIAMALKQPTLKKALEVFKGEQFSWGGMPEELQRNALSRFYQAWATK